jgi:hypothetical protein
MSEVAIYEAIFEMMMLEVVLGAVTSEAKMFEVKMFEVVLGLESLLLMLPRVLD